MLALLGALIASPALAFEGGGTLVLGAPHGALGEQADVAGGVGGHLLYATPSGKLGLRLDGSVLLYGSETLRIPVAGTAGRLNREITTDNWVAQLGLGPQIVLPLRGARPYVHGFAGLSYLSTESYLRRSLRLRVARPRRTTTTPASPTAAGAESWSRCATTASRSTWACATCGPRPCASWPRATCPRTAAAVRPVPHRGQANVVEFRLGLVFSDYSHSTRH